jgi:uncharacterized phage protein (TIGR02220 family)
MNGWWKFHRKMLEHAVWFLPPSHFKVWITILCEVNHKDADWWDGISRVQIEAGSFVTSQDKLAETSRTSRQSVRAALKNLCAIGSISTKSPTKKYTHIYVTNWKTYSGEDSQANQEANQSPTNDQPKPNQSPTTTGEGREHKKEKKKEEHISFFPIESEILMSLNTLAGTTWKPGKRYGSELRARLADGFTLDDLLSVVKFKTLAWKDDEKMRQYLTPVTLFRKSNFERYLEEVSGHGKDNGHGQEQKEAHRDSRGRVSSIDAARLLRRQAERIGSVEDH